MKRLAKVFGYAAGLMAWTGAWAQTAGLPGGSEALSRPPSERTWSVDAAATLRTRSVEGVELDFDRRPGQPVVLDVEIAGRKRRVVLLPHTVRGRDYRLMVHGVEGVREKTPPPVNTLRGWIDGEEGSVTAGGVFENGLYALVRLGDGRDYWIQPAAELVGGETRLPPGTHVLYEGGRTTEPVACATVDGEVIATGAGAPAGIGPRGLQRRTADMALDLEYQFYSITGSVLRTAAMADTLINIVDVQYEREVDIRHFIGTIIVRTMPVYDPDGPDFLDQLRTRWLADHQGVPRDLVMMLHARGNGGRAYLSSVCAGPTGNGFGNSGIERPGLAYRCNLIAHEAGHMWGACHCPCLSPPYTMHPTTQDANRFAGSPASECGPTSVEQIVAFRNTRGCLGTTTAQSAIPNDDCARAVELRANPDSPTWGDAFGFSTIGASTDGPPLTCRTGSADVWYRLVAPCNGVMTVSTCGGGAGRFDTVMAAYGPGAPCPPEERFQIACSDDDDACTSPEAGSRISFPTVAGSAYLVRVLGAGFPPRTGLGLLRVSHSSCPRPANDSCVNAAAVGLGVDRLFSTIGATTGARLAGSIPQDSFLESAGDCGSGDDRQITSDIWFRITSPCDARLRVRTCGSGFDTKLAVYGGGVCPAADELALACDDDTCGSQSEVTVTASDGEELLIRVGGYFGAEGAGTLRVDRLSCLPPPNDLCGTSLPLRALSASAERVSMAESRAEGTASCTPGAARPDVWFRFVPPGDGSLRFDTCGTESAGGPPTAIGLHRGCPTTEANRIACGFAGGACPPGLDAAASARVNAGEAVYVRVAALVPSPAPYPAPLTYGYEFRPGCPADIDGSGSLSVQDVLSFLGYWFERSPSADYNRTGGVTLQDLLDFLAAYFDGC